MKKHVKRNSDDAPRMFVGLDLHKNYLQTAVVDDRGTILREERIPNTDEDIEAFSNAMRAAIEEPSRGPFESRQDQGIASAKVKTDNHDDQGGRSDAGNLLRGGYIPESYIPPKRIMDLREMVRYRASLVRMRVSAKNKVHAILLMNGIKIEGKPFTREFVEELKKVGDYRVDEYLAVIKSLNEQILSVSRTIRKEAIEDESTKLLKTIPGIGYYSALLIMSEIGDSIGSQTRITYAPILD